MSFISNLIGSQPILALFLAVGLGYAVGQITVLGFSLGIGAVLFVGLFLGAIAPKAQIAGPIGLIGLIMFLYGVGILYGRQFFDGLKGARRSYNLLSLLAVAAALAVALGLGHLFDVQIGHTLGLFAGSMTGTATLQAAIDVTGSKDPSIGYPVAYPFGVIGPILCFYFMTRRVRPTFPPKPARFHMAEVTLSNLPNGEMVLRDVIEVTSGRHPGHRRAAAASQCPAGAGDDTPDRGRAASGRRHGRSGCDRNREPRASRSRADCEGSQRRQLPALLCLEI